MSKLKILSTYLQFRNRRFSVSAEKIEKTSCVCHGKIRILL